MFVLNLTLLFGGAPLAQPKGHPVESQQIRNELQQLVTHLSGLRTARGCREVACQNPLPIGCDLLGAEFSQ